MVGLIKKTRGLLFAAASLFIVTGNVLAADLQAINIALIEYEDDSRYKQNITDARYQAQPWGRLSHALKLAIKESRFAAQKKGVKFNLEEHEVETLSEIKELIPQLEQQGTHFFMLDLPGEGVRLAAASSGSASSTLFNLSALDNSLRNEFCQSNLLHVAPSRLMLTDAMAQYLVSKKWNEVLVLYGEGKEDKSYLASLKVSAKKFGLKLIAEKPYKLGNDPRQRYRNNIALLTGKDDYNALFVVDSSGEFAVDVPYALLKPRPVVGSAGLVSDWWHWAWDRNGAPQVNKRFMKKAKRHMTGYDWSAWLAVKLIAESILRQEHLDTSLLLADLKQDAFKMDGAKGYPLNFRPWNNQLRQPVFLTSLNRVINRAPIEGFLHPRINLDVLGNDKGEGRCNLSSGS
ncbi:amino acid ABC transporter substrate-binding protein [Neptuniibacter sp. QD29_5]|uniref:amino acid ABC transporter substrate-binding protein n=1 Tax=unclassified Neptuniibacter TaxID=2630693 RepID=UPI0039F73288